MNFEAPTEIGELRASLAKLLDRKSNSQGSATAGSADATHRDLWARMAEMGIPALMVSTEYGGFGFAAADLFPVLEEFGRSLVVEPFFASCVLGATALEVAAPARLAELMPKVASGETILALAHAESGTLYGGNEVGTRALSTHGQWLLTGAKRDVLYGQSANFLLTTARVSADTIGIFLVSAGAPGMTIRPYRLIDESPAAEVRLEETPAVMLAQGIEAERALERAIAAGIAALAGEAVGVARGAFDLTVEYLNVRQQFGRPLSANQVLRHRVAEMAVALETIRSAAMAALCAAGSGDYADIARAKMLISRHGVKLVEDAVQLHGGLGMSVEYGVGNYLRRMTVIDLLFEDGAHHAAIHGAALLSFP